MNNLQKTGASNPEKPFPGCIGRMVNLFDFGPGMTGNRLLTDTDHHNGSRPLRGRSDVVEALDPIGSRIEEELMEYDLTRSSSKKNFNGTPMKMLIAQEMLKEPDTKHNPPSLVAKLMGLDALPEKQPAAQRCPSRDYLRTSFSLPGTPQRYMQQENDFLDKQMQCEIHSFQEQPEYKDVYEVWQQSPKSNYSTRSKSPPKGRRSENQNEKMALVRQKFTEAKRLATDEKLRQSKDFQDALEFLSSNKDLFVKFLQEPNSLFSQHPCELKSIPPPPQSKRITVLRPSKTIEDNKYVGPERKSEKQIKKQSHLDEANGWDRNKLGWNSLFNKPNADSTAQPTRIVVLKPTPGKTHDIRAVASSPSSPRYGKNMFEELENDDAKSSREVAKAITQQMRNTAEAQQKEDTVHSSVFSNGYVGDESSFNRSENDYIEEGTLSDSEVMTPTSRYSWDYINRFGSPYSSSSFSRASFSPESSVCREAKKRLSERWAMMASSRTGQEQRQVRRSSSTLGEMLALSDTKTSTRSGAVEVNREQGHTSSKSYGGEQELKAAMGDNGGNNLSSSKSCGEQELNAAVSPLSISKDKHEGGEDSTKNLLRSRSLPVSSTIYGATTGIEVSSPEINKSSGHVEVSKSKSGKSTFKGKVSSLFFSRSKKTSKEKRGASAVTGPPDESHSSTSELPGNSKQPIPGKLSEDITLCATNSGVEGLSSPCLGGSSPASISAESKEGISLHEDAISLRKPGMLGNICESQDQPSPISVLERQFEDDICPTPHSSGITKPDLMSESAQLQSLRSNLISKSPRIGSLARSLSWDDSELATPDPLNSSATIITEAEEEQERYLFVQSLLSSLAALDRNQYPDSVYSRWHSPESPLDPSLLDKFFSKKDNKELWHGVRFRQWRSNQRLIFDCINAALMDITGYGSETSLWTRVSTSSPHKLSVSTQTAVDEVWNQVKDWFSSEVEFFSFENGDNNSLVAESVVRNEVVGRGWVELLRLEVDGIGKDIEGKMLEELVEEALFDFTGVLC